MTQAIAILLGIAGVGIIWIIVEAMIMMSYEKNNEDYIDYLEDKVETLECEVEMCRQADLDELDQL